MSTFAPGQLLYGGDYNPEQWSRETWCEDIALMRRARVNTVTLGVFAWSALEPSPGVYTPEWLDEVIDLLDSAGIGFILATPTASPPPWFTRLHPDALPVSAVGNRLTHGSRDTYAVSAPAYREAARRIAGFLAERYGHHPGLRAWHVHNEYGSIDHGPHAAAAFRTWLQARYGSLDAVNEAWTTAFWSQRYGEWSEITPPRATQYLHNPAQVIDFKRFFSDELLAAFCEQRDVIRATGSSAPVTTNFMLPEWNTLEQWSWARSEDIVSLDHYLDSPGPDGEAHVAYGSDLARSWAGGPWLLMEQNAVGIRVGDRTYTKTPDRTIRNSLAYIARGSQGSLFFQWRASLGGSEQWHGALVPHAGADSRAYATAVRLGEIVERLAPVSDPPEDGPLVRAQVAIVWDAQDWWALETPQLPNDSISYSAQVRAAHRAFYAAGVPVDAVAPGADLSRYRLLVLACDYAMDEATTAWVERFARDGGAVVVTFLSGMADANLRIVPGGYPGLLRGLLGVWSDEIHPLAPGQSVALDDGSRAVEWTEAVRVVDAEVVARFVDGPLAGGAAITRRRLGHGSLTYVSTQLEQDALNRLLATAASDAGAAPTVPGAAALGVEAVRRRGRESDFLFLLHHGAELGVIARGPGVDLLTGASAEAGMRIEPGGAAVLQVPGEAQVTVAPAPR